MAGLRSKKYFAQSQALLVDGGGADGQIAGGLPLMISRADGAILYDLEGRAYTDYYLNGGVHILGHANRNVVLSAKKHAERGLSFGFPGSAEVDLAAHIVAQVPSIKKVRFTHSGQEAVSRAVDLAFEVTGRNKVVRFSGPDNGKRRLDGFCQNGDACLPYNDTAVFERTLKERPKDFACVIVPPVMVDQGIVPAQKEFLGRIHDLTRADGVVLIFNETQSGFRLFPGCVHTALNICPDLICLGSVIGGGFPLGIYGGRSDLMTRVAVSGEGPEASGFVSPVILRAGLMALRLMTDDFYRALNDKARAFAERMNAFFQREQISAGIDQYGSMMYLCMLNACGLDGTAGLSSVGRSQGRRQCSEHLRARGVIFPAAETEPFFISGKHRRQDLVMLQQALEAFFATYQEKGVQGAWPEERMQ